MQQLSEIVLSNLRRIQEKIAEAELEAGRPAGGVCLVGVTKYVSADAAAALLQLGIADLGEARPQQLWDKASDPRLNEQAGVRWHLIGHLQRNKVDRTVPLTALIHSVDSERLLRAIDTAASSLHRRQQILLEVNCSGDSSKDGLTPQETLRLVGSLDRFPCVELRGLMTMAALEGGPQTARQNFADLRDLREQITAELGQSLPVLSMGMSGDLREAILEGATHVRVGSALWEGVAC